MAAAGGGLSGHHALYFAALAVETNPLDYTRPLLIVLLSAAPLGLPLTRRPLLGGGVGFAAQAAWATLAPRSWRWSGPRTSYSVLTRWPPGVPAGAIAGFYAGTAVLAGAAHPTFEATV